MKYLKYLLLLVLFSQCSVFATNYYVDQNHGSASDSNPGTESLPFLTIQKGVDVAQAGDTVIIKGDTYLSAAATYNVTGNGITTVRSGSSDNNIVIRAYPGHVVVIDGDGDSGEDGILLDYSYLEFHGIGFTDFNKAVEGFNVKTNILIENCEFSVTYETGLRLRNIDGLVIRDTYVHHCFEAGISMRGCNNVLLERVESSYNSDELGDAGDADGFHSLDGDNIDFVDCTAIGNNEDGFDIASNGSLINCISANHVACNVKLWRRDTDSYAPKRMDIVNMINYGAGQTGIKATYGPQLYLANSVIYDNGEEGVAFRGISISEGSSVVNSMLVNNIIVGNGYEGVGVDQSGPNTNKVDADYNLYYNNASANNGLNSDTHVTTGAPDFVNAATADFHLQSTSPAINAGMDNNAYQSFYSSYGIDLTEDFEGTSRPAGDYWDLGSYEFDSTLTPPDAPSNLSATVTGGNSIDLTWTDNSDDETQFKIERSLDGSSGWTQIGTNSANDTTYSDSGLDCGTTYYYRVRASNAGGSSSYSNTAYDTTDPCIAIAGSWTSGTSHTAESGSNRLLVLTIHSEDKNNPMNVTGVTYGGESMTEVVEVNSSGSKPYSHAAVYMLKESGISSASSSSFSVTWSSTPSDAEEYSSVFLTGVDQTITIGSSASNSSTSSTVTTSALSTSDGDMVIVAGTNGKKGEYTVNNGFTEAIELGLNDKADGVAGYKEATGANETPSITHSSVNKQVIIGLVVQVAGLSKSANSNTNKTASVLPEEFALHNAYPNPFNPTTNIRFDLPQNVTVKLSVYNNLGQLIKTIIPSRYMSKGRYQYIWNGKNDSNQQMSSGIYLISLQAGEYQSAKKIVLMK